MALLFFAIVGASAMAARRTRSARQSVALRALASTSAMLTGLPP